MRHLSSIAELLARLDPPFTAEGLFDHLPDLAFFIKNARAEYLVVNQTFVDRCGLRRKTDLIGRTSSQVYPPPFGDRYEEQDRKLLRTGRPLTGQLELHLFPSRDVGWCLTTKLPLTGADGTILGLVGVSQDLRHPNLGAEEYRHIAAAVTYAEAHLADPPAIADLARIAEMSPYQLDRRMRHVFGLTTGQWLLKLRIDLAQRQLAATAEPIAAIAHECGYQDQSAFTRQFRQATGLTPREYRSGRSGRP